MAYKFQFGDAEMSGALEQVGDLSVSDDQGQFRMLVDRDVGNFQVAGSGSFGTSLTIGGALAGASTIAGSGLASLGSIAVDNGSTIGTDSDTDMLTLTNADNITVASDVSFVVSAGKLEIGDGNAVTATAAELNYNDITTLGTAAASKTLTIKGDSTWTVAGMTCADLGILTTVDINGGSVDGATIGAASRSSVACTTLDANGNVDLGDATSDTITCTGRFDSDLVPSSDSARDLGTSALQWAELHVDAGYIDAITATGTSTFTTVDINGGNIDGTTIGAAAPASMTASYLQVDTAVQLDGAADATFSLSADSVYFLDADGLMKRDLWTDIMTLVVNAGSGNGLSTTGGELKVALSDTAAGAVDVAADSVAFIDANDSSLTKKESIADLVSAMAGSGLDASSGVLSVQGQGTPTGVGNVLVTLGEGWTFGTTTLTASHNWTLPAKASATAGDIVRVKMPANMGGFEITITGSGAQTIDGQAALLPVEQDGAVVNLIYLASDAWGLF